MSDAKDVLKFVLLVEQHQEVLLKSQTTLNKKKKEEAVALLIPKWEEISKIKLTQASLFKKISNVKTRAKSALQSGKPVNEWQAKMLEIMCAENQLDEESSSSSQNLVDLGAGPTLAPNTESQAEQFLNSFETDHTKLMTNEQLQRLVMLQQFQVLTLQRKRLEHLSNIENAKSVTIDYVGFDDGVIDDGGSSSNGHM